MKIFCRIAFLFLGLNQSFCFADEPSQMTISPAIEFFNAQPTRPKNIWTITGILRNEQDEPYGFALNMYHQNQTYQLTAAIIDINQKKIVWQKNEKLALDEQSKAKEQLGSFFWHFSPINSSLIIGFADQKSQVFNLKIDLLEPTTITQTSSLTKSLKFKQYWSGRINGHFNLNGEEQFVSSDNFWLQQLWQKQTDTEQHAFEELLCKFPDGGALFAIQLHEKQTIHAALAGRFDAQGQKQPVSQFMCIKPPSEKEFDISLEKNKDNLHLSSILSQKELQVFMGQLSEHDTPGFCIYQSNPWANMQDLKPVINPHPTFLAKTIAFTKKPFKIPFNLKNKLTS